MQNGHRVVITGLGAITPLANTAEESWQAILAGKSGFGPFSLLSGEGHTLKGLCEIKGFDANALLGRRRARRRDRSQQIMTAAADEAMAHSGLEVTDANRTRIGICFGTGIGGVNTLVAQQRIVETRGPIKTSPLSVAMIMPNGADGMIAIDHGIQGAATTITTACAAANDAIGYAMRQIRWGLLDAVLTGGMESIMQHVTIGGFESARATSRRGTGTPSPFDRDRDGLVVGEGAGALVIESLAHAKARGANILGELVGYGQTTDAYHITAPPSDGSGAARAITMAMNDAGLNAKEVSYISAHGTGTPLNDSAETSAIKIALGDHAYDLAVSSTKSMTGHVMGGTGAIESIFCINAMRDNVAPPTINYVTPDPACDLDYVPNHAREMQVDVCLNHAFGFGGQNSVLAIKRFTG